MNSTNFSWSWIVRYFLSPWIVPIFIFNGIWLNAKLALGTPLSTAQTAQVMFDKKLICLYSLVVFMDYPAFYRTPLLSTVLNKTPICRYSTKTKTYCSTYKLKSVSSCFASSYNFTFHHPQVIYTCGQHREPTARNLGLMNL